SNTVVQSRGQATDSPFPLDTIVIFEAEEILVDQKPDARPYRTGRKRRGDTHKAAEGRCKGESRPIRAPMFAHIPSREGNALEQYADPEQGGSMKNEHAR